MEENPLDLEQHEEETLWDVWKRRFMFGLLIALCITFAAPAFSSCERAIGGGAGDLYGKFKIGDETIEITRAQFDATWSRLALTMRVVESRQPESDEEIWAHILMNAAAQHEGVHIPRSRVDRWLARQALFQQGGTFDDGAYRAVLAQRSDDQLTHRSFSQTLEELLRIREYLGLYETAFELVPSEEAFERWRDRNEKLSVTYVVQPFADLDPEVAGLAPSDEQLAVFSRLPTAASRLRVNARKTVEAAYFLVRDMTVEQVKEIDNLLRDQGLLSEDLRVLGLQEYYGSKDAVYTRENWLRSARADYALAMADHERRIAEWEKLPEDTRGERPPEPPDPALDAVPEDFVERYEKFWRDRIEREVLSRAFLRMFAERAERENRSFADLAQEYEVIGVRVVANAEPLQDTEIADGFPEELGRDSELATTVRTYLKGPAEGRTFTPEVHLEPIPTTSLGRELDDRGYMAVRLAGYEPPRVRGVDEARDEIVAMWREHEVRTRAKDRLEAIRTKVLSDGVDLPAAAAEVGLDARTLRRFNRSTPERRAPPLPPGVEADDARRTVVADITHRNRVVRDYPILAGVEAGQFRSSVLLDDDTGAAYLVRLDEKHKPGPMEIADPELQAERFALMQENFEKRAELQSFEALTRRYHLEVYKPLPAGEPAEDESDSDTGAE